MSEFTSITNTQEAIVFAAIHDERLTLKALYKVLSPVQLQCAQLRFFKNKSYSQIADIRGCSPSTARLNVKYAMAKIMKHLDDEATKGCPLFSCKHPTTGPAVPIDADINPDALETIELELTEASLEAVIKTILKERTPHDE